MPRTLLRRVVVLGLALVTMAVPLSAAGADVGAQSVVGWNAIAAFGTASDAGVPNPPFPQGRNVAVAANPTGSGYWVATADGTVYPFGGAPDGGYWKGISAPIVGIAANPSGPGYWTLGRDGVVYALGGAPNLGDAKGAFGGVFFSSIVANPAGEGFWLVALNGAVVARGAPDVGSHVDGHLITSGAATADGRGLWLLATTGEVFPVGSAPNLGSATPPPFGIGLSIAAATGGPGYWLLLAPPNPAPAAVDNGERPPPGSGSGRRIVYANAAQRVWIMNDDDSVYSTYRVSGKRFVPNPGSYRIYTRTTGRAGDLRLDFFVGFAYGSGGGNIGFHRIPVRPDGSEIQTVDQLGQPLSHGCVREAYVDAQRLFNWSRIGDLVVVLA